MKSDIQPQDRKRLVLISMVLFSLFALLIIQFYRVQVLEREKWSRHAHSQHYTIITEPSRRGLFYANPSVRTAHHQIARPLVIDVPKFHLYIDPLAIPEAERKAIIEQLCAVLHLHEQDRQRLGLQFDKKSRSRKLVMWLDRLQHDRIMAWWQPFAKGKKIARNALFFVQDWRRCYPYTKLLGQVLHTVRDDRDVQTQQAIPTGGLEMMFNQILAGKDGKRQIMRSPRHPLDTGVLLEPPENGADIYLTIDHYLQAVAEEEIAKAVQQANGKAGWAILMDPVTGEILALAQYPWFEPAAYRKYFNDPKLLESTKIHAVTDPYEPGSIMKPITLTIGLLANAELKKRGKPPLFSPQEKMDTLPKRLPGRSKPIKDVRNHKFLNMYMALQKSSNVYMATVIHRVIDTLGAEWYRSCLQDLFGFGVKTGIELPAESVGLLPRPGKMHPNGALEWSSPTPYSLSMGHNVLATSLQMMRAYGILANGGYEVRPRLIRQIVKTNEQAEKVVLLDHTKSTPLLEKKRILPAEVVQEIVKAMQYVTKPGGAGAKADIFGYTEVGKSGTSEKVINGQYSKKDHISTFIGFAPVHQPRFVLMIVIDDPEYRFIPGVGKNQHGGQCAGPAFRAIATRTLEYLGIEPDDPFGYPSGDPRSDLTKAHWVQEARELRALYEQWNR